MHQSAVMQTPLQTFLNNTLNKIMSLPEFHAAVMSGLQAAKKMMEESEQCKQKLAEFERFQKENIRLSEENTALKKELDGIKNTIAFPKERLAEISEEQRKSIHAELTRWSQALYSAQDRILDNSDDGGPDRYARIAEEEVLRVLFIQKLMTILGG